jgi:hypothetical protein
MSTKASDRIVPIFAKWDSSKPSDGRGRPPRTISQAARDYWKMAHDHCNMLGEYLRPFFFRSRFSQYQERCDRGEKGMDHHQAFVGAVNPIERPSCRFFAWRPSVIVRRAEVVDEAFEFDPPWLGSGVPNIQPVTFEMIVRVIIKKLIRKSGR